MLLNILYLYYQGNINRQVLNRIFIIAFFTYVLLHLYLKKYIYFISLFDVLYFVFHFIKLKTESENINNTDSDIEKKPLINNLLHNIKKIDIATIPFKKDIEPEFQIEKFKPYEYNIKGTITELMNNISV